MGKQTITIIILAILLVVALGFIGYNYYSTKKIKEQQTLVNQGIQFGYEQAILQVMQQAATCQEVPLAYNNNSMNIIAIGCLQQSPQQ